MLQKRPGNVNETPPENTNKTRPGNINKTISNKTCGTRDIFIFQLSACMHVVNIIGFVFVFHRMLYHMRFDLMIPQTALACRDSYLSWTEFTLKSGLARRQTGYVSLGTSAQVPR